MSLSGVRDQLALQQEASRIPYYMEGARARIVSVDAPPKGQLSLVACLISRGMNNVTAFPKQYVALPHPYQCCTNLDRSKALIHP